MVPGLSPNGCDMQSGDKSECCPGCLRYLKGFNLLILFALKNERIPAKKNTYKNPQLRDDTSSPFGPPSFCLLKLNLFKIRIDIHFLRIDQSFLKHHFLCHTSVPPRCGPAAPGSWRPLMVWSCSGSSDIRRSRLVLVGGTAGADC